MHPLEAPRRRRPPPVPPDDLVDEGLPPEGPVEQVTDVVGVGRVHVDEEAPHRREQIAHGLDPQRERVEVGVQRRPPIGERHLRRPPAPRLEEEVAPRVEGRVEVGELDAHAVGVDLPHDVEVVAGEEHQKASPMGWTGTTQSRALFWIQYGARVVATRSSKLPAASARTSNGLPSSTRGSTRWGAPR